MASAALEGDIFDSLLNIETSLETEGYIEGYIDGLLQARAEAYTFGLQKGFEQHMHIGKLAGRALVWRARLRSRDQTDGRLAEQLELGEARTAAGEGNKLALLAPADKSTAQTQLRLERYLNKLLPLVDLTSLDTTNSDEAVAVLESRMNKAELQTAFILKALGIERRGLTRQHDSQSNELDFTKDAQSAAVSGDIENFGQNA